MDSYQTLIQLGRALWADPIQADIRTQEIFSAVSLCSSTEVEALDATVVALLAGATRSGRSELRGKDPVVDAFFALPASGRFLLVGLHLAQWSYEKAGSYLEMSREEVERLAWQLRLDFGLALGCQWPAGAPPRTLSCPEYDPASPWTQRFLDEEFASGMERVYFQNHLMACDSCRRALSGCRQLYYTVDGALPRIQQDSQSMSSSSRAPNDLERLSQSFERLRRESIALKNVPSRSRGKTAAMEYLQKWDVLLVLAGLLFLLWHWMGRI